MLITGTVRDKKNGETLPRAEIYESTASGDYKPTAKGTITDLDGNYSFAANSTHITASYTGFKRKTLPVGQAVNFELSADSVLLPEVVISAKMVWPRVAIALIFVAIIYFLLK